MSLKTNQSPKEREYVKETKNKQWLRYSQNHDVEYICPPLYGLYINALSSI